MAKAERAIASARLLLDEGDLEGATNRAYYAALHAAGAALALSGVLPETTKSHSTVIGLFGKHIVLAGRMDADHGRLLNRSHQLRTLADYDVGAIDLLNVDQVVSGSELFVLAVGRLKQQGG
ncbi:hypothetical protein N825_25185 [Skermanella stibiiresistens SB22]|uniref:HEPN domain-containing protein n=1 Tax=Skermanella stibiiresistens SB22 TaxID=1385369 RepID=W9HAT6_9PROT|nr:HEPN domain-containing protein [Skermanella stibiiresistens]EWY41812.1 hypothetical protein N825_25185 [Skermanella stibiiresistens SB22]